MHQRGDLNGAEKAYRRAIDEDATNAAAWQMLGVLHYQRKNAEKAFECFEKSLKLDPTNIEARINFGVMLHFEGRNEEAVQTFDEALRRDPTHAEALHMRGFVLIQLKRAASATTSLRLAVKTNPQHAGAWFQLGNALAEQGLWLEALPAFRRASELDAQNAEVWNNLGNTYLRTGQPIEAEGALRRALKLNPNHMEIATNLGTALFQQGKIAEAGPLLQQTVQRSPKNPKAWFLLGQAHVRLKRLEEAIECLNRSLELDPTNQDAVRLRLICYSELGLASEARSSIDEIETRIGTLTPAQRVLRGFVLPAIPQSLEEIRSSRARVLNTAHELAESGLKIEDPLLEVGGTCFFLGYDRESETEHQKAIAQMYLKMCPQLDWTAPHCTEPRSARSRIRLGICSAFLRRHSVGRVLGPLIQRLDKDKFELVLMHCDQRRDELTQAIDDHADKAIQLPVGLYESRGLIAEQELDLLLYPDIGMDAHTYFLAFSRLARVQATTWGHPSTTGIPNMDVFISSQHLESSGAEKEYSERLVTLPDLITYFPSIPVPPNPKSRAELGLREDSTLYGCPQSLFKLHPDFDDAVAEILRRDVRGVFVLNEGAYAMHGNLVRARWQSRHPDVADRVLFLPKLSFEDYLSMVLQFDVILDPFYFGGGTTSLEIFAMGRPVVTMPGSLMRSRITYAEYLQMGFTDLAVESVEAYAEMAYRVANDTSWRAYCREQIAEKSAVLFENSESVRQFEDCLTSLYQ